MPMPQSIREAVTFSLLGHPFLTIVAAAFAFFLVSMLRSRPVSQRTALKIGGLLLLLWLGGVLLYGAIYASSHLFYDHVEPCIVNISLAFLHGKTVYHAQDSAERYSMLYGPVTYLYYAGLFRLFGAGIIHAKLSALAATVCAVAICMSCFHFIGGRRGLILGGGYLLLGVAQMAQIATAVIGDPIVLLCTSITLFSAVRLPRYLAAVVFGAALGAAVDTKAHAPLYILPFFAILWGRSGFRAVGIALAMAAAVAVAPFALSSQISFSNHLVLVRLAARQSRDPAQFLMHPEWLLMIFTPLAALLIWNSDRAWRWLRQRDHALFAIILAACLALAVVPASKVGAGIHHFFPFVVALGFLMAAIYGPAEDVHSVMPGNLSGSRSTLRAQIGCSLIAGYALVGTLTLMLQIARCHERRFAAADRDIIADLRNIEARFPSQRIAMGYGDNNDYALTYYRADLSARNQPAPIDPVSLDDTKLSKIPIPAGTLAILDRREVGIFLIPRGNEPFSMTPYTTPGEPLFDERFRSTFLANYRKCGESRFYDLWCAR